MKAVRGRAPAPFNGLPAGRFGVILADPPWRFHVRSPKGEGKSAQRHYGCMDMAAIQALPVASLAAPDCALFMWATAPMMPQAIATVAAWGFEYKSMGAWAKQSSTGARWHFGAGYTYRSAAEFFLLATRGTPQRRCASVRNLVVAPVREHSRKPDAMRADVERMYDGPFLELFAREPAPGWTSWGNEVGKYAPPGPSPASARTNPAPRTSPAPS